jgi:trimeric autotransporter adhesin
MALTATDLFNDATTREIGGIGPDQVSAIVSDLVGVQQMLSAADPQINSLTDLHTHVIINQLNEEIATVELANSPTGTPILGTDLGQFVGRAINDIHRDIIDIAQGDPGVQAIFNPTPLPALNTPATPFLDNATQTTFVTQWIQDSNHLGQMATTIENNGFQGDIAGLVQQIQTFENSSNAFDQSQGGLWSARFWNEFRSDGTAGTAANALIDGLQTHNAGEVNAAVTQLSANASDVAGNNLMADGGSYASVVAAAQATAVTPNPDPTSPPTTTPPTTTPPTTTPPAGTPDPGTTSAGDGGNHLVADLIALLQGGGQNSAAAVVSDLQALVQAAGGGHTNNGLSALLGDLQTAAGPVTQTTQPAPNAPASAPQAANNGADLSPGIDTGGHHFQNEMHHFHHMWG